MPLLVPPWCSYKYVFLALSTSSIIVVNLADVLVALQGWMGVKEDWAGLDRILCKRILAPVIIFDNRGMGESDVPEGSYSISLFVSDMMTVVEAAVGKVAFDVFGISMGGCIAQMAALSGNPLLRRVVIGCSTPGGPDTQVGPGLLACFQLLADPAVKSMTARELTTNIHYHNLPAQWIEDHPDMFEQFIVDVLRHKRPYPGTMGQMKAISKFNVSQKLHTIRIPTLIVHGDEDEMVPVESGKLIHNLVPESHMVELKGAGHLFWITHLHDTIRPVAAFLSSVKAPSLDSSPHLKISATANSTKAPTNLRAKL